MIEYIKVIDDHRVLCTSVCTRSLINQLTADNFTKCFCKMLEANDKNNARKDVAERRLQETYAEKLLEAEKSQDTQMFIEFDDFCYSICCNCKRKLIMYL